MAPDNRFVVAARLSAAGLFCTLGALLWAHGRASAEPEPLAKAPSPYADLQVADGETLQNGDHLFRLANIITANAAASCTAERALNERAAAAAEALVARAHSIDVRHTGRADPQGRQLVFVDLDGRDLGELLMSQGLAIPTRVTAHAWCDAAGDLTL